MRINAFFNALSGAVALPLPAIAAAQSTQPTQVPLRADIVSASEVSNAAIEVREGRFGRLGAPETGFCEYSFDETGNAQVRDRSGTYGPGVATPDGCIAPDSAELPRFDLICAAGEQFAFRINALPGAAKATLLPGRISAEGGVIEQLGRAGDGRVRITCTSREGFVTLTVATTITLTPDSRTGTGDLGTLELDTSF